MSRRSHGRPTPSRGARVEQRKADRTAEVRTRMVIPEAIRALSATVQAPPRLPCLVDPACPVDHLHDPRGKGRIRRG